MEKRRNKSSFLYRLIISFCTISVLSTVLITAITFTAMNTSHRSTLKRLISDTMHVACDQVCTNLIVINKLCDNLTRSANMQEYLQMEFADLSEQYSTDLSGSSDLMSMISSGPCLHGIYIFGENNSAFKSNTLSFNDDNFRTKNWYRQVITNPSFFWFYSKDGSLVVKSSEEQFLYIGHPFIEKTTGKSIGVILAEISVDELFAAYADKLELLMQISLYDLGETMPVPIVNGDADLTAVLPILQTDAADSTSQSVLHTAGNGDIVITAAVSPSPWTIVGYVRAADIQAYTTRAPLLILAALFATIFVAVILAVSLSNSIVRPIQRLVNAMENVENGDFSVSIRAEHNDEIGRLSNSFNHLIVKIHSLIDQIYHDQEKLRMAEFSAMQAQINPHFLYNSLDSTIWLLKMGQVSKAIEMLQALSALFRVALSRGKDSIPIAQELRHAQSYLTIQHMRYSSKFDYAFDVDEKVLDYEVIKVLIQPLIENSIYHGICEQRKIRINIAVKQIDDIIRITVSDNGIGIPPEKLLILQKQLQQPAELPEQGYGLYNANARVKICYGEKYGIRLDSVHGEGTTVTIEFPKGT